MSRLKTDAIRNVNASVDGITLDTSGNVAIPNKIGIDETSPQEKLHVGAGGKIRFERSDGSRYGELFNDNNFVELGASTDPIRLNAQSYIRFDIASNEKVRITSDGKIGINRTAPTAPITARRTDAGGTGTSGVIAEFANSSGYGVWFGQSSASGASWGATTGDFYWNTGGLSSQVERLRITSAGNVGIGSTNPGCKLVSIQGDASNGNNVILDNNYSSNGTTTFLKAYRVGGLVGYALQYKDSDTRIRQGTYTNHAMELVTNDNARLTLHNDGHARFSNAISFNNETATANRLNDYEEGSWTPTAAHGSFSSTSAKYTKIGRMVFATYEVTFSSTSGSSHQNIGGLPFAVAQPGGVSQDYHGFGAAYINHVTGSNIWFYNAAGTYQTESNLAGKQFRGTAVYYVA